VRDGALGLVVVCGRVGIAAGRVALLPLRVAARSPVVGPALGRAGDSLAQEGRTARVRGADQLEAVAGEMLASPELGRAVDQALASPLPETVARSLVEQHVVRRVVEQVLASTDLEAAVEAALEHTATERLVQETLASPGFERLATNAADSLLASDLPEHVVESAELQRMVEEIASGPAVRAALFKQTSTFGDEVAIAMRRQAQRLDDAVESTVHGWLPGRTDQEPAADGLRTAYGGLAARGLPFLVDLALGSLVFLATAAAVGFVGWVTDGLGSGLVAELLASIGWLVIVGAYFVFFWTVAGQTPGMRVMSLRVVDRSGRRLRLWRSLVRLIGLALAIIPLFAGFLPVLVDSRRRALQDFLAGTVVRTEDVRLPAGEPVATIAQPNGAQRAEQARST
jgi:uncharacterized RDD family membrane protein YckC